MNESNKEVVELAQGQGSFEAMNPREIITIRCLSAVPLDLEKLLEEVEKEEKNLKN